MANFDVSYVFEAIDKFSPALNDMKKTMEDFRKGTEKIKFSLGGFSKKMDEISKKLGSMGKKTFALFTAPFLAVGGYAVKQAMDLEEMNKGFIGVTQSATEAAKIMEKIKDISMSTEWSPEALTDASQKFIGLGMSTDAAMENMETLSKVAEIAKGGLESVSSIYARMIIASKSKGGIDTKTLNALTQQNIPIMQKLYEIAKEKGINLDKALKSKKTKGLSIGWIEEAMRRIAIELPDTLGDQLARLHNISRYFAADLGTAALNAFGVTGNFKEMNDKLKAMEKTFNSFLKGHQQLVKWVVIIAGIAAALAPVLIILSVMAALSALITAPWFLISALIIGIGVGLYWLYKNCKIFKIIVDAVWDGFKKIWDFITKIIDKVKTLFGIMPNKMEIKTSEGAENITTEFNHKLATPFVPTNITQQQKVKSEMVVTIKDKGNNVQNVQSKSDGKIKYNLGHSLAT